MILIIIRCEKTKPQSLQTATVMGLCFWGLITCPELHCDGQYTTDLSNSNWNVHGFPSFTVIKKAVAWILSPLSKFRSPRISKFYVEATISGPGSFTVQSGDHFRSCDHLRSNLGIICGPGSIAVLGSLAVLYICRWITQRISFLALFCFVLFFSCPPC